MKITLPKYNWQSQKHGTISLCMIMKNEARLLPRCLNSVRGLVNETIIVDTGSTDDSASVARNFGAQIITQPWQNDFSAPRNVGIRAARCSWVLIMDPDEVILREDHNRIRELTCSKKYVAFQMVTRNYNRDPRQFNYREIKEGSDPFGQFKGFVPSTKTRLFRNDQGIRFEGCWHELADYYVFRNKLPAKICDIPIHHVTQADAHGSIQKKKNFYLALGEKKVKEWPHIGQAWWELAVAEAIAGYRPRAIHSLNKALSLGFSGPPVFITLARCHNMIGNKKKGKLAFEKAICRIFPNLTHANPELKTSRRLIE